MLAVTTVCLRSVGLLIVTLVLSGDIAQSVAAEIGLGEQRSASGRSPSGPWSDSLPS